MIEPQPSLCESRAHNTIFAGAMLLLLAFVFASKRPLFFDEPYYLNDVGCIQYFGINLEMMRHLQNAPGPLFALLHTVLQPLTHLEPPWVRLVSWALMTAACFALGLTIRYFKPNSTPLSGFALLLFPTSFLISGLALTEAPAILCFVTSLYFLTRVLRSSTGGPQALLFSAATGLAFGLAIFGRQTLLPASLAFAIALSWQQRWKELVLIAAMSTPWAGFMYFAWGSLRPPYMDTIGKLHPELSLDKLVLCVAYVFVVVVVIMPDILRRVRKMDLLVFASMVVVNLLIFDLRFLPMRFLLERLFPWLHIGVAELLAGSMLFGLACSGAFLIARETWSFRSDRTRLAMALAGFAGAISISTIGFTGKYLVPIVPLLILAFGPGQGQGWLARSTQYVVLSIGLFSAYSELIHIKAGGGAIFPSQTIYLPDLLKDFPNYMPLGDLHPPVKADQVLDFGTSLNAE